MTTRVYLDWNATTPLRSEARAAMLAAMDAFGNPSSVHAEGRAARQIVETAREQVAALVGAAPRQVIFTSGGTEANNLALGLPASHVIVSAIEHPSVLDPAKARDAALVPVTPAGVVDLDALDGALRKAGPGALVSLMLANNETGAIQPVAEAAARAHAAGARIHCDAVQAAGKIAIDRDALGADLLTVSAHKIGGPKGVGALIVGAGLAGAVPALLRGGGQERGARGGTENVVGIAGFGAAAAVAAADQPGSAQRLRGLRNQLETGLLRVAQDTVIFAAEAERLPNTVLAALPGLKAETAVIGFDLAGIAVSSGSACSSGKVHISHVLEAMGASPEAAQAAVRFTLGWGSTESDIEFVLNAWLRRRRGLLN